MRKIAIIWAGATPLILLLSAPLSDAADQGYLTCVVALFGLLFMFTAWTQGKGADAFAGDVALAGASTFGNRAPDSPALHPERRRMVLLVKTSRSAGDVKSIGTSWLGGMPALGRESWPRDGSGRPMHLLAQIDLADAAPKLEVVGLPATGGLAFFATAGVDQDGDYQAAVVYVPAPAGPTAPPIDLPLAGDHTFGGPWSKGADDATLLAFPRWAVDLVPHTAQGDGDDLAAIIDEHGGRRVLTQDVMQHLPNGSQPSYWDSAQRLVRAFEAALRSDLLIDHHERQASRLEEQLAKSDVTGSAAVDPEALQARIDERRNMAAHMRTVRPELERKAADMRAWAFAHDPWKRLAAADVEQLKERFVPFSFRANEADEQLFYRYSGHGVNRLEDFARETLRAMVTGPDAVYGLLPDEVHRDVELHGRWNNPTHQMFGPGVEIQTAVYDNAHNHLLMQIASDDLLGMGWGDAGVIQFWISPSDLADQAWDRAFATFDAH